MQLDAFQVLLIKNYLKGSDSEIYRYILKICMHMYMIFIKILYLLFESLFRLSLLINFEAGNLF